MSALWSYLLITVCLLYQLTADDISSPDGEEQGKCQKPDNVPSAEKAFYSENDTLEVQCETGYYPSPDTITCVKRGNDVGWDYVPQCIGVTLVDQEVTSTSISVWISCTPQCPDTWRFIVKCCAEPYDYGSCKTSQNKIVEFTDLQPSSNYRLYTKISTDLKEYNLESRDIGTKPGKCRKPDNVVTSAEKTLYSEGENLEVQCETGYYQFPDTITCVKRENDIRWEYEPQCIGVTMDWRANSSSISVRISCTPQCPDTWIFAVQCCSEPDYPGPCTTLYGEDVTFINLQPSSMYKIHTYRNQVYLERKDIRTEKEAQCSPPTIQAVAYISAYKPYYKVGEEVTVQCIEGYDPSSFTMKCNNPRTEPEWSPPTATCTALCKKPTIYDVYRLSEDKTYYKEGESVTVQCIEGYYPSPDTMRCNKPRAQIEWDPPTVTCIAQCTKPIIDNVDRLSIDKEYYKERESVTVQCKEGYYPSSNTMRCNKPGEQNEWDPSTVTCIAQCKKPTIDNVYRLSIDKEYYKERESVTVQCIEGYYPSSNTMRCNKPRTQKEWDPSTVTCIAQCTKPTIYNVGRLSEDKKYYKKGESVTVQCIEGSYPSSDTMRCNIPREQKEWDPPTVTCIALCRKQGGRIVKMDPEKRFYNIDETVTVNCPIGYQNPNPSVRCVKSGYFIRWNNLPQCIALCAHPSIPNMEGISVYKEYYKKGELITVKCKSGYYSSSPTMTCNNPRSTTYEWTPPTITCIAQCTKPIIDNVYRLSEDKEYYYNGDSVTVQCKGGYYPSSDTMRCNNPDTSREWTPPTITCIGVTTNCSVTSTSISARISCTPQCPDGWRFTVRCCTEPYSYYRPCKRSSDRSVTFTDLQPSSKYRISTTLHIDWKTYSLESEVIRTGDSVPGQPEILKSPSMEDNTIRWKMSEKWGDITGFQMNISAWRDYNVSFAVDESRQFPPNVTEYKIPLQYGTNYTITLRGFTSAGAGEVTTKNIETDIGDPSLHMEETMSDVTLQLHPILNLNGPIKSYEIIVFGGQEGNSTKECLNFKNTLYNSSLILNRYTAAVLHAEALPGPTTFTLGDNNQYNGFHNAPLIPNHNYTVYIRVTSRWKHVEKSSCAFAGFLQIPETVSSNTHIIAGSISAVFILLVLLLLAILWRRRSSSKSRRSSNIPLKAQTGLGKKRDIPVDKFPEVVKNFRKKELADHDEDEEENANISPVGRYLEYQDLPGGFLSSCTVGQAEENQAKNRYKKVLPYDNSRVVLRSGPSRSDYINASYIDGYKAPKSYIATQGPLSETLADFWRMVWQENSSAIVMLTGLQEQNKVKCECYWPEESQTYGDITVSVQKIIQTGAITIRSFSLKKVQSMVQITVEHLQYLRWPDHGVPRNPSDLVQLIELMNKCNTRGSGPVIVHCSAGIGRTGTFIALDILLKMAHAVKKVNVYNCVSELRKKRVKMVQEKEQYVFLYDALLEALLCGNTIVPVSDIQKHIGHMSVQDGRTNMNGYYKEFQDLEKLTELYQIYQCKEGKKPENQEKNRNPNILPGDHWRPALMSALNTRGAPGYINAVFVNSNSKDEVLIATQLPMKQTLTDFWALVWDYKCTVMVMMQKAQDQQENGCRFFPDKGETGYGIYKVKVTAKTSRNGFTGLTLSLRKTNETYNNSMEVKLWCLDSWALDKPLPENPAAVISLIEEVEKHQMTVPESHILVICCDGASRSGLFCAGIILCEQIRSDGCLDVSQAVRSLRRRRCQFIPSVEQYSFCYILAQSYLDSFETYGNFK